MSISVSIHWQGDVDVHSLRHWRFDLDQNGDTVAVFSLVHALGSRVALASARSLLARTSFGENLIGASRTNSA